MGVRPSIGCETIKMPTFTYQEPGFTKYISDKKMIKIIEDEEVMKTEAMMGCSKINTDDHHIFKVIITSYVSAWASKPEIKHSKKTKYALALQITHIYDAPTEIPEEILKKLDAEARLHVAESGKKNLPDSYFGTILLNKKTNK